MSPELHRIRVWDLPTRLFHWALAACFVASVVSAKLGGNAMAWHFRFGYTILVLLAFRFIWGWVGGRWSRFASFVYSPFTLLRHFQGRTQPGQFLHVGHSPTGALSVFALLGFLSLQVATGLAADDEISNAGPLVRFVSGSLSSAATHWHKTYGQWTLISLVALHVAAIAFYFYGKRQNLVSAMLSGDKRLTVEAPHAVDNARSRCLALALFAACAAGAAWLVSLGNQGS